MKTTVNCLFVICFGLLVSLVLNINNPDVFIPLLCSSLILSIALAVLVAI